MSLALRPYTESFEPETANAIRQLIDDLIVLGEGPMGYGLYTSEIQSCLSVGLLLAAVSVSTALLELFIRDMTVALRIESKHDGDIGLRYKIERSIEEDRDFGFNAMLKELRLTVIAPSDVESLHKFYEVTRIPFAHGLVRRLGSSTVRSELMVDWFGPLDRRAGLEHRLEDTAINEITFAVQIIKRYLPWLLRRYGY
ncbi:MAG TPA: hypothetical protein VGM27_13655 [Acidobacteriaceae bacterium]